MIQLCKHVQVYNEGDHPTHVRPIRVMDERFLFNCESISDPISGVSVLVFKRDGCTNIEFLSADQIQFKLATHNTARNTPPAPWQSRAERIEFCYQSYLPLRRAEGEKAAGGRGGQRWAGDDKGTI